MAEKTFTTPDAAGIVGRAFFFVIIRADDPSERIIGDIGINTLDPAPSVGFVIHPEFWGRGDAKEAVAAVVRAWWGLPRKGDPDIQIRKLFAACNMANEGRIRVLSKNGFRVYMKWRGMWWL
ncbi:GNAT domain-containing protein [Aspergillus leporis]|jgi:RimJ/RimL family protein N-acetyltransferase|uniref:GNAT domain-containing protein n=1 Tax=Aspergillus leporis TaxID=41062 RepID=A0A5N5WP02_9EURO|nr:GNAT domain-containing protein [Aspergillus leporis]